MIKVVKGNLKGDKGDKLAEPYRVASSCTRSRRSPPTR